MGQRASDTRGVTFEDVVVPKEVGLFSALQIYAFGMPIALAHFSLFYQNEINNAIHNTCNNAMFLS